MTRGSKAGKGYRGIGEIVCENVLYFFVWKRVPKMGLYWAKGPSERKYKELNYEY